MKEDELTPGSDQPVGKNTEEKAPKKPALTRKYHWDGIRPLNPDIYNQYGNVKIRPWAMTDEEIDACIAKHPELARLWRVS